MQPNLVTAMSVTPKVHSASMDYRLLRIAAIAASQHSVASTAQLSDNGVDARCVASWNGAA